uniref:Uncharacterized protein n=1 Tax=viral metagenome TaxID=1070528 RepID=A0A6C0BR11_9ZZZZ
MSVINYFAFFSCQKQLMKMSFVENKKKFDK